MTLPLLQIDAFADRPFAGNPAAVIPSTIALSAGVMQRIAEENNLSETAFTVPVDGSRDRYSLRWFTPTTEVELCGHATLAAAAALRDLGRLEGLDQVTFETASGELVARFMEDGQVQIDLPAVLKSEPVTAEQHASLERALDIPLQAAFAHRYILAVVESEAVVRSLRPSMRDLEAIGLPVIITAPGNDDEVDFVSRFFAPTLGVQEDPVTGSAHCQLVPYWAAQHGRPNLAARQLSARGGRLDCTLDGDRVRLTGGAHVYLRGILNVD